MTKTALFIGCFSLLFVTLSVLWARNRTSTPPITNKPVNDAPSPVKELNSEDAKKLIKTSPFVIINFGAEWCGGCKTLKPVFEEVAEELKNQYIFAKVNTDKCRDLAAEYQIKSIPTVLIFNNGQVIHRITGSVSRKEALIEKIDEVKRGPQDLSKLSKETLNEELFKAIQTSATLEDVERLINAGADVNCAINNGLTPLMMAIVIHASRGEDGSDMLKMLLAHGAKPEFTDSTTGQLVQAVDFAAMMGQNCQRMAQSYDKISQLLKEDQNQNS